MAWHDGALFSAAPPNRLPIATVFRQDTDTVRDIQFCCASLNSRKLSTEANLDFFFSKSPRNNCRIEIKISSFFKIYCLFYPYPSASLLENGMDTREAECKWHFL